MTDITDSFNRANGSPGSNWIAASSFPGLAISSNAIAQATAAWGISYWNPAANTFTSDQHAQITYTSGAQVGIVLRWQGTSSQSGYMAFANNDTKVYLYRLDSGTFNLISSGGGVATGNVVSATITGSSIVVAVNGVTQFTNTDATYSGGSPGMALNNSTGDDWSGGPIVVAGGTVATRALRGVGQ